jgi:hypothetical protein
MEESGKHNLGSIFAYNIGVTYSFVGLREGLHLENEPHDKETWVPINILNGLYFGTQVCTPSWKSGFSNQHK